MGGIILAVNLQYGIKICFQIAKLMSALLFPGLKYILHRIFLHISCSAHLKPPHHFLKTGTSVDSPPLPFTQAAPLKSSLTPPLPFSTLQCLHILIHSFFPTPTNLFLGNNFVLGSCSRSWNYMPTSDCFLSLL